MIYLKSIYYVEFQVIIIECDDNNFGYIWVF
jgi:hypothetical protein